MVRRRLRAFLSAFILAAAAAMALPAAAQDMVLVPVRTIYPGETVSADMLQEVPLRRQLRNPAAVERDWRALDGKVARRTLLPGRMIPTGSVREAWIVEPGKPVQVLYVQGGLEIALSAVALQAGAAGDMIRLRNVDSGSVFSGVVMADGTVRITAS
ncbi:MAG: flagellar basal body P-ring formation protein FlgA [Aquamicrobium sp.]|uniref:flagellar basal body P-ring formation chaperone FlgA n=1 Tax=Aquamicrobium sp. TaxID=1872579 RepID=UPI00349E536C|nr:flagellar basal body P-ring formation protein FlgA [Aquamicrobium sp.]